MGGFYPLPKMEKIIPAVIQHLGIAPQNPRDKIEVAKLIEPEAFASKKNPTKNGLERAVRFGTPPCRHETNGAITEEQIREFYASWEWKRLSYDVKINRGRKCECCGAKAPNVRIHTDHVKPIRHHWHLRLERSNLQVLCEDCNMGKGSRDETDFRVLNGSTFQELDQEPGLSKDEAERLLMIREQLRLN